MFRRLLLIGFAACVPGGPADARTLIVGEGGEHQTLAAAVRAAQPGDTVRLGPGTYYECASLSQAGMVLEGAGPSTVISDQTCEGKALLIVRGADVTVRDLVLARARVPDMNGAGIRLEAQGLTVERVVFENVQVGVLAGIPGPGRIVVRESSFRNGGVAGDRPTAALMVGEVAVLVVERSTFEGVKGGQISSAAARTEVVGNTIGTGVEPGAGPAVLASGGTLVMRDNVLRVGPNAPSRDAAVAAIGGSAELRGNRMENTTGRPQRLLLDWSGSSPALEGNTVGAGDALVSSGGLWRHRAGGLAREVIGDARAAASATKRAVLGVFGR